MKTRISIILLFISLALLMTYAADVQWGFLPLSPSVRGGGLGGSAVILSIIAFAISLKERSSIVVILLLINGGLIVGGMAAVYFRTLKEQQKVISRPYLERWAWESFLSYSGS